MAATEVSLLDLARDPGTVARGLVTWQRGDVHEAVQQTLAASAGQLHSRDYTLWAWSGRTPDGDPAWLLPVTAAATAQFAPRGPALALLRCLDAAVFFGEADPTAVRLLDWNGHTALVAPDMDPEVAAYALDEIHRAPSRAAVAELPDGGPVTGAPIPLGHVPSSGGGIRALAHELSVHPVRVALTLIGHGQRADEPEYPAELVAALREWGCVGEPPEPDPVEPDLDIAADPCPRRRHARKVLQRLLRMGKVGAGYHTEFDHLYRGAPANERQQALEVGEALLRAGLLGEKPSVGQRHVYLRREALPAIHALIERGESDAPALNAVWTAPAPTELGSRSR